MNVVNNGVECVDCFNRGFPAEFQEPILGAAAGAGGIQTPVHQVAALLWNCDVGTTDFRSTVASDFTDDFNSNTGCDAAYASAVAAGVIPEAGVDEDLIIYTNDVEPLIDDNRMWQNTGTHLFGFDATPLADLIIIANTPIIAELTYPEEAPAPGSVAPTPTSRDLRKAAGTTYIFLGSPSTSYWSVKAVPTADYTATGDLNVVGSFVLDENSGVGVVPFGESTAITFLVTPGDRVIFHVLSDNTLSPHGLVFGRLGEGRDAKEDTWRFFEVNTDEIDVEYDYANEDNFVEYFGAAAYGYTSTTFGPSTLFSGYLTDRRAGSEFYFTSYVYGPQLMSVAITVDDY
jgi:hypothetical protein